GPLGGRQGPGAAEAGAGPGDEGDTVREAHGCPHTTASAGPDTPAPHIACSRPPETTKRRRAGPLGLPSGARDGYRTSPTAREGETTTSCRSSPRIQAGSWRTAGRNRCS